MTPDALSLILESLAAGCTRAVACKAARVSVADLAAACATDDDVAERVEAAEAEGGALAVPEPPPLAPVLHLVPRDPTWADVAAASQPDAPEPQRPRMHATPDAVPRTDDGANGGLDVEMIEREAARYAPGPFGYLLWVESRLATRGFHAMSPWWRESLRAFYDSGKPWGLWCVGRGAGKALAIDTPIATPSGWSTMGDLAVGDVVFDERGIPCRVLASTGPMLGHECYVVEFSDGHVITADAEHLWKTITRRDKRRASYRATDRVGRIARDMTDLDAGGSIRTTREIADTLTVHAKSERNHAVPVCGALRLPDALLPVDPYTLGVWLGDGTSANGAITVPDQEIVDRIRSHGREVTKCGAHLRWNIVGLNRELRLLGLKNAKRIPPEYLRASFSQRLELFRGLMDTDGTCTLRGACNYDTITPELRDGFWELATSLGIKTRPMARDAKLDGRVICTSWRFTFNTDLDVFTVPRKRDRLRPIQRCAGRRYIVAARRAPSVPVACIAVDSPTKMFLAGRGMIPTHNSTTLERVAATNALLVPRSVPPGQTWSWPFVSVGPDDANRRIDGIAAVFRAVGLPVIGDEDESGTKAKAGVKVSHSPRASAKLCDLRGNAIALMSIAGTVGNVSGPSTIGATVDEAAKLLDKATHANPLTEIIASLAQTSRGRPGWRAIVCSSAWHRSGAHFQLIEQGDTEANYVARIGTAHLATALRGLEAVATWEEKRGDTQAAAMIRAHAATLGPESPLVPTWVANPAIGSPDGLPWEDGALATRKLVEVLPEQALGGVPRIAYWLRENASVPLDAPRSGSAVAPNMTGLGAANARLASSRRMREDGIARGYGGLLPGDPRGAGASGGGRRVL